MAGHGTENQRSTLIIEPLSKRFNVQVGNTIYEALSALDYPVSALCGGAGTCGKCKVKIEGDQATVSPPTERERKMLGSAIDDGMRLACQTKILGNVRILLTGALLPSQNRILIKDDLAAIGRSRDVTLLPVVKKIMTRVPAPTLDAPAADYTRLVGALPPEIARTLNGLVDDDVLALVARAGFPKVLRENDGHVVATVQTGMEGARPRVIDVHPGKNVQGVYGLAVDVGTTTVVGYLINLDTGLPAAVAARLNPQVSIGEDVVSRIAHVTKNNAGKRAKDLVIQAINEILEETCKKGNIEPDDVVDFVLVGNTAMYQLFLGMPPEYLAVSPFVPVVKAPVNVKAATLGINGLPAANVYSPPVIAGYVGTDTIAGIVATRLDVMDEYTLFIDIGTNGELVLGNKDGMVCTSCAAGPALEGAQITHGMRAADGAIEGISIDPGTLQPTIRTIGNMQPTGICGSGLIDAVAEMLKAGILTRNGNFNIKSSRIKDHERIIKKEDDYHFILFDPERDARPGDENGEKTTGERAHSITISQPDIRQLQLAKGAFLSGTLLLLQHEHKKIDDIEQVILAGAFGSYINKENAKLIGLFPDLPMERVFQVGNAAGLGAQDCLKNADARRLANQLAFKVLYHEISSSPSFQVEFAKSLYFPYQSLSQFPNIAKIYENIPLR